MSDVQADTPVSSYARLRASLFGDSVIYAGVRGVASVSSFAIVVLLSRLLTPSDVGRYTLVVNTAAFVSLLGFSWIGTTAYRYSSEYEERGELAPMRAVIFRLYLLLGVVVVVLTIAAGLLQLPLISGLEVPALVLAAVLLAATGPASNTADLVRVQGRRLSYAALTFLMYLGPIAFLLIVAQLGDVDLIDAVAAQALPTAAVLLGAVVLWAPRHAMGRADARALVGRCWTYGGPLVGAGIASWLLSVSDRYVLVLLQTSEQVGIYTVGYQIGSAPLLLLYSVVALPLEPLVFSAQASLGTEKADEVVAKAFGATAALLCITVLVLGVESAALIDLFLDDRYGAAASIVPFAAVGVSLLSLGMVRQQLLSLAGNTRPIFKSLVVAAIVNLAATFILVPIWSIRGAGAATIIGYATYIVLIARASRNRPAFQVPTAWVLAIVRATIGAAGVAALIRFVAPSFTGKPIVETLAMVVVYVALLGLGQEDSVLSFVKGLRARPGTPGPTTKEES